MCVCGFDAQAVQSAYIVNFSVAGDQRIAERVSRMKNRFPQIAILKSETNPYVFLLNFEALMSLRLCLLIDSIRIHL